MSKNIEAKNEPIFKGFDEFVAKVLQDWKVPGMGIAVIKGDKVILAKGYGYRDVEKKLPVDAETIFAIGSSSKAFTSMSVGILVDQGKLEWDKPVRNYMPDFKMYDNFASERMTPRDLLSHRSGLPRHELLWYNSPFSRKDIYDRLQFLEPSKDFRTFLQYQNLMYMTAGYLVERVTGLTWEEFTSNEIFQKLGMKRSSFSVEISQKDENAALPYSEVKKVVKQIPFRNINTIGPAGSINSTVLDMAKWVMVHLHEGKYKDQQIISQSNLKQMHMTNMPINETFFPVLDKVKELGDLSYGLGWFLQPYRGHRLAHHGGNIDGFSAMVSFMPDDDIAVVLLTNMNSSFSGFPIMLNLYDRLLGYDQLELNNLFLDEINKLKEANEKSQEKSSEQRKPNTKPSHELDDYTGDFTNPAYGDLKIYKNDGQLKMTYNGIVSDLNHYHYDIFESSSEEELVKLKVSFLTDSQGNITSLSSALEPMVKDIVFTRAASQEMFDPKFLVQFIGKYRFMETQIFEVALKENKLSVVMMGTEAELEPYMGTQFKVKGAPASIEFEIVDGRVNAADLLQGGAVFLAEKIE